MPGAGKTLSVGVLGRSTQLGPLGTRIARDADECHLLAIILSDVAAVMVRDGEHQQAVNLDNAVVSLREWVAIQRSNRCAVLDAFSELGCG